ncbi:hypothetical protein V8C26DRAFT_414228 [Trichoderma gracile]
MSSSATIAFSKATVEVEPFPLKSLAHSLRGKSLLVPIALRRADDLSTSLKINSADCQILLPYQPRRVFATSTYDGDVQMRGIHSGDAASPWHWSVRESEPCAPYCITNPNPLDEGCYYRCRSTRSENRAATVVQDLQSGPLCTSVY